MRNVKQTSVTYIEEMLVAVELPCALRICTQALIDGYFRQQYPEKTVIKRAAWVGFSEEQVETHSIAFFIPVPSQMHGVN